MTESFQPTVGVWLESHGNEREIAHALRAIHRVQNNRGILLHDAHPEAAKLGVRFLGDGPQIMAQYYDGDPDGDGNQQAVYNNLKWLDLHNPIFLTDVHETYYPGFNFIEVGKEVTPEALVGGIMLGPKNVLVTAGSLSFYEIIPNGVAIETSLNDFTANTAARNIYDGLEHVVENIDSLRDVYDSTLHNVRFFQNFELPTRSQDGQLATWIKDLEEMPNESTFAPIDLNPRLRRKLRLPARLPLYYGYWGHNNMSLLAPDLGETKDNVQRRDWFGSVLIELAPPVPAENGNVVFLPKSRGYNKEQPDLLTPLVA